jgi:hypothetical protein
MFKPLAIVLILFSSLFSANIAVVGWCKEAPYCLKELKKEFEPLGHSVSLAWKHSDFESFDLIVSSNAKSFLAPYKSKTILSCFEPPVIVSAHADFKEMSKYLCVFTWNHDICNGKNIEKFFYPCGQIKHDEQEKPLPFNKRKLACLVNSFLSKSYTHELYSIRRKVVKFYKNYYPDDFSLYAQRGWKFGYYPVFKGEAADKGAVLRAHKFIYCFENWDNPYHYISEKIFDAFNDLCVPIYLGSSRITDYIPKETFIDARSFGTIKAVHAYIESMDENTYNKYIEAIISFSRSDAPTKFTHEFHIAQIIGKIHEHLSICGKRN